jgi:hypothetical protein
MQRQYGPTVSRFRYIDTPRGKIECGVLPVGTICRPRINHQPLGRAIIEAWEPRDYTKADRGKFRTVRIRGGHIAHVRDLATGQRYRISDVWLLDTETA